MKQRQRLTYHTLFPTWKVYVDGVSNDNGSGVEITMISPEGFRLQATLRFKFPASTNEVEYGALLARLRLAKVVGTHKIEVFNDSQLVINQVFGEYQTCREKMVAYVSAMQDLLQEFKS
uniref:RNase H type-1 domain-containing protein n=1 Tax=Cannabis sativa TaxID=3483 RepID=A0A803QDJ4_CANSA